MIRHNKAYLSKLEDLISDGGYMVRYERGNFKSGYCVLELVQQLPLNTESMSEKNQKLMHQLRQPASGQTEIEFNSETQKD
jgi:hypothetical protein